MAIAVVIAVLNRRAVLDRGQAVTTVVENEAGRVSNLSDKEAPANPAPLARRQTTWSR